MNERLWWLNCKFSPKPPGGQSKKGNRISYILCEDEGLSWWLRGKECACKWRRCGFNPWVGKTPWWRKWQPTAGFLPGKSHGQRSLAGYSPRGHNRVGHNLVTKQQQQITIIRKERKLSNLATSLSLIAYLGRVTWKWPPPSPTSAKIEHLIRTAHLPIGAKRTL